MNAQPEPSPEISDLIVSYDAETLIRQPVLKREVIDRSVGRQSPAAHLVERVPDRDGALDPEAVDALLVRAHTELQRLSEEFEHGTVRGRVAPTPPFRLPQGRGQHANPRGRCRVWLGRTCPSGWPPSANLVPTLN